jgi:hypothetical protein
VRVHYCDKEYVWVSHGMYIYIQYNSVPLTSFLYTVHYFHIYLHTFSTHMRRSFAKMHKKSHYIHTTDCLYSHLSCCAAMSDNPERSMQLSRLLCVRSEVTPISLLLQCGWIWWGGLSERGRRYVLLFVGYSSYAFIYIHNIHTYIHTLLFQKSDRVMGVLF